MPVFQVSSKSVALAEPPRKKPRRLPQEWLGIFRFLVAIGGASGVFVMLSFIRGSFDTIFVLLPVLLYLAVTQFRGYRLGRPFFLCNLFFNSTPLHLLLTFCLALVYYGAITAIVVLIHLSTTSHIILVTTALAWAIICDPVRAFFQRRIDRRFNLRDRESVRAVEAFTSTLRDEIDLDQLRERFLALIQQILRPYFVILWVHSPASNRIRSARRKRFWWPMMIRSWLTC